MTYRISYYTPKSQVWKMLPEHYKTLDEAQATAKAVSFDGFISVRIDLDPLDQIFTNPSVKNAWVKNYF